MQQKAVDCAATTARLQLITNRVALTFPQVEDELIRLAASHSSQVE